MRLQLLLLASSSAATATTAAAADGGRVDERLLAAYIFHRHGDRSAKAWKPVNLTILGAAQMHQSGAFYRSRYLAPSPLSAAAAAAAAARLVLPGVSADVAVSAQLAVTAPRDPVLHSSALSFLQGLYPPRPQAAETLANGSRVLAPLNGYQFVPVLPVDTVAATVDPDHRPEDSAWLQGGSGCINAEASSNRYFASAEYREVYDASHDFYQSLLPVINGTYDTTAANFKNAYSIFDLVNVAFIHNSSIQSSVLLSQSSRARLHQLASVHEWNLAYNASEPVRAIAGQVLAGQVLDALGAVVGAKPSATRLHAQFGSYATLMAFFGLAQLPVASPHLYDICDYASSMVFELVTTAPADAVPSPDDIAVRFLFANCTASEDSLRPLPLFGQRDEKIKWRDFLTGMTAFAVTDTAHWCELCGRSDGRCASTRPMVQASTRHSNGPNSSISSPVAGVIGALVTLIVVLSVQGAAVFFGRLRLVRAPAIRADTGTGAGTAMVKPCMT